MIGKTVGRYRITAKLGEGGMGSVWKAEDPALDRTIALKFLPDALASSPEGRRRFQREARAASKLTHPGIATVYDTGEADGLVYIALQHVDGETLSDRVARGPLPIAEAVRIAREAAEALGHAHAHGVLHRDVTSRNIMVKHEDESVVVVDFGLALPEGQSRLTQAGTAMGTVAYMAPEVVQRSPADRRSDLYGLGVVLYEMLTGAPPFEAERVEALLYATVHEPVTPPSSKRPELTPELDRIVLTLLAKDPEQRYPSAPDLIADLRRLDVGSPTASDWAPGPTRRAADDATIESIPVAPSTPTRPGVPPLRSRAPSFLQRPHLLRALGLVILIAVVVALLPSLPARLRGRGAEQASAVHRIAVLPLHNDSQNPEESNYLANGIGQELVTKLTKIGLSVIPWVTAQRYSDRETPLADIAKELRVDALLIGTFTKSGDVIQGTLGLVDVSTGAQSWVDEFAEPTGDLLALQKRIAIGAATRLKGRLTGQEEKTLARPAARSADAYDFYLHGSASMQDGTPEAEDQALAFFEKAQKLDPELAEAYVGIGAVHTNRYFFGRDGRKDLEEAQARFERAVQLDPALPEARGGLVKVLWEQGRSEECLKQGLEVAKLGTEDVNALWVRGQAYTLAGLPDRAVPIYIRILDLDPGNLAAQWFLVFVNAWASRYRECILAGEEFTKRFGEDAEVHTWMGCAYQLLGNFQEAATHYERAIELFGNDSNLYVLVMAGRNYRLQGQPARARQVLRSGIEEARRKLAANPDNPHTRAYLAVFQACLGEREEFIKQEGQLLADKQCGGFVLYLLGIGRASLGDADDTIRLWKQSLSSGWLVMLRGGWGEAMGGSAATKSPSYAEFEREHATMDARLRSVY